MQITIQATIDGVKGQPPRTDTTERADTWVQASGLGLFLREAHALLRQLQGVVRAGQVARFVERVARCGRCDGHLATKDSKAIHQGFAHGPPGGAVVRQHHLRGMAFVPASPIIRPSKGKVLS